MGTPRYSIITVCLNAKEELKKTLSSIEQQTYRNFEWIIIDGQSKDGTVDVVRNHPCVTHLVSEPDEGIYDAMNKGGRLATGDYLLFLNAGDWLSSNSVLQKVDDHLNNDFHLSNDLLIGDLMVINRHGESDQRRYKQRGIGKEYFYSQTLPHPATFIKRKIFERYGGYCEKFTIRGDHDFFARLAVNGVSFSFLPICISTFPLNGLSSKMKHSDLLKDELTIVRKRNFSIIYRIKMKFSSFLA